MTVYKRAVSDMVEVLECYKRSGSMYGVKIGSAFLSSAITQCYEEILDVAEREFRNFLESQVGSLNRSNGAEQTSIMVVEDTLARAYKELS